MFAVPNWAVNASSLAADSTSSGKDNSAKKSKKRKRERELQESRTRSTSGPAQVPDNFSKARNSPDTQRPSSDSQNATDKRRKQPASTNTRGGTEKPRKETGNSHPQEFKRAARDPGLGKPSGQVAKSNTSHVTRTGDPTVVSDTSVMPQAPVKLTALQAKMRSKLTSARFRHLNETLYTSSSADALAMFTNSPDLFADYHAGFAQQVRDAWPQNPVEAYVRTVKTRGAISSPEGGTLPLPRRKTGSCTIADLGCGDAPLARGCQANVRSLQLRFHNYDLHTPNSFVTKADISNLPLRDGEIDIAVFCLSLMGTNWVRFVEEAWRVLRGDGKGEVWVAEVKSRFGRLVKGRVVDNSVGKRKKSPKGKVSLDDGDGMEHQFAEVETNDHAVDDETDVTAFIKVFTRRGFQLREGSVDKRNKMFVSMVFTKSGIPTVGRHKGLKWNGKEYTKQQDARPKFMGSRAGEEEPTTDDEGKVLKPCVYKVR